VTGWPWACGPSGPEACSPRSSDGRGSAPEVNSRSRSQWPWRSAPAWRVAAGARHRCGERCRRIRLRLSARAGPRPAKTSVLRPLKPASRHRERRPTSRHGLLGPCSRLRHSDLPPYEPAILQPRAAGGGRGGVGPHRDIRPRVTASGLRQAAAPASVVALVAVTGAAALLLIERPAQSAAGLRRRFCRPRPGARGGLLRTVRPERSGGRCPALRTVIVSLQSAEAGQAFRDWRRELRTLVYPALVARISCSRGSALGTPTFLPLRHQAALLVPAEVVCPAVPVVSKRADWRRELRWRVCRWPS
jgi:hypothetical protein